MELIEKQIDHILDVLSDGIYISDREGNTLKVNTMYEKLIGLRRETLIGRKVQDLVREGVFDVVVNPEIVRTGQPATFVQTTKKGQKLILNGHPIFDEDGQVALVVKDIEKASEKYALLFGVAKPDFIVTDELEKARTTYKGQPSIAQAKLAFFDLGKIQLELIESIGEPSTWLDGLQANGESFHHLAFMVENGGKALMITADAANHPVWSLARPDWEVKFDADKPAAAAARSKIFGMIASERIPFVGYHMPFPATGFVEAEGDGFRYVPSSYQLMLG